jgi:hypothetical protein
MHIAYAIITKLLLKRERLAGCGGITPVISGLWRPRQKDLDFEANLSYIANSRPD